MLAKFHGHAAVTRIRIGEIPLYWSARGAETRKHAKAAMLRSSRLTYRHLCLRKTYSPACRTPNHCCGIRRDAVLSNATADSIYLASVRSFSRYLSRGSARVVPDVIPFITTKQPLNFARSARFVKYFFAT